MLQMANLTIIEILENEFEFEHTNRWLKDVSILGILRTGNKTCENKWAVIVNAIEMDTSSVWGLFKTAVMNSVFNSASNMFVAYRGGCLSSTRLNRLNDPSVDECMNDSNVEFAFSNTNCTRPPSMSSANISIVYSAGTVCVATSRLCNCMEL